MRIEDAITVFLVDTVEHLSQTKWNKLLFLIDGMGAVQNCGQFTDFNYIKLQYGPVPENYDVKVDAIRDRGYVNVQRRVDWIGDSFTYLLPKADAPKTKAEAKIAQNEELQKTLNTVITVFGDWTATRMSNFTHKLDAWKNVRLMKFIELTKLADDSYLRRKYGEGNIAKLLHNVASFIKTNQT